MNYVTEDLEFRAISYPQLKRLPKGTRIVKQSYYPEQKRVNGVYSGFTKKGHIITLYAGNNRSKAHKLVLEALNLKLREVALIWENPTEKQFLEVIK